MFRGPDGFLRFADEPGMFLLAGFFVDQPRLVAENWTLSTAECDDPLFQEG